MLFTEAVRLAAIECLCPTAAIEGLISYPTMARGLVFDSRRAQVSDLHSGTDEVQAYYPVIAVYSGASESVSRNADAAAWDDRAAETTLEIVAELAVVAADGEGAFVDALAESDGEARLVLGALTAQIRRTLEHSDAGFLFRKFCRGAPMRIRVEPHDVPELGVRFHRNFMSFTMPVTDDDYSDAAGLPEPLKTLAAMLPSNGYSARKLTALAASFAALTAVPLNEVAVVRSDRPNDPAPAMHIPLV